jgi:transcriptional regulator with XRE-family HTH domain
MPGQDRELIALGRAIRRLRAVQNIGAGELAVSAGLTQARLEAIEAGRCDPRLDVLLALAHGLSVKPSELVKHTDAETTGSDV